MHAWMISKQEPSVKKERKLCATTPESKLPPSSLSDISDSTDSFVFVLFAWRFCLHQVLNPSNPTSVSNMEKVLSFKSLFPYSSALSDISESPDCCAFVLFAQLEAFWLHLIMSIAVTYLD